eukprot:scaffold384193_cov45-Prasinocladus_malaysianus.AAC.1
MADCIVPSTNELTRWREVRPGVRLDSVYRLTAKQACQNTANKSREIQNCRLMDKKCKRIPYPRSMPLMRD